MENIDTKTDAKWVRVADYDRPECGITTALMTALARLDAEFAASDGGLRRGQAEAINELKDMSFALRQTDGWYRKIYESCRKAKAVRDVRTLFERGLIDKNTLESEVDRIENHGI